MNRINFQPLRLHNREYSSAVMDIQRNFDALCSAINRLEATVNKDTSTYSLSSSLGIVYSVSNLTAIPTYGRIWFDPVNGWLKFRKRSEDSDPNIYVINLSNSIPE